MALLEQENRWLKAQLFGRSSEKHCTVDTSPAQGWLFGVAEPVANEAPPTTVAILIAAHARQPRGRKKLAAHLPRIEVLHDLSAADKVCAHDGTALVRIGEEVAEQLDFQPARLRVLRHIRPQYACPCCRQGVKIAPAPPSLFPKSFATPSLLAQISTAKFVDGTPLYRQEPQFARLGVHLPRATMALWMIRLGGTFLVPLINLLAERMLGASLIHCDETRLQVLKSDKAATADHWMWVRACGPPGQRIVLFDYDASRGGAVPLRLLTGFQGILLTDGYAPYAATAAALNLVHAGCMAHARRKFEEARLAQPECAGQADVALAFIRELYQIERSLAPHSPLTRAARLAVRQARSAPILARFHGWLETLAPRVLPEGRLGKALRYTLGQWPKLGVFLSHSEVPLDNNRCENAIRPFVIGRKGWLFSDTVRGAKASANLYSLIETAKANDLEPHAYLSQLFERLPHLTTVRDFEALLPFATPAAGP